MKQHGDYVAGPHRYWMHFGVGLVFGAALGAYVAWGLFEQLWTAIVMVTAVTLVTAFACGH